MAYSADCNKTYRREKSGGKSKKVNMIQESIYKGSGQLTRQQFLFYEMRVTAKLMDSGLDNDAILAKIIEENLYQYPTEKTIKQIANGCIKDCIVWKTALWSLQLQIKTRRLQSRYVCMP